MPEYLAAFRIVDEETTVGFLSDGALVFTRIEDGKLRRGELLALASGRFPVFYEVTEPAPSGGLGAFSDFLAVSWQTLEVVATVLCSPAAMAMGAPRPKPKRDTQP